MLIKHTWKERYLISISEELSTQEIMILRNVNKKQALLIRQEAIKYCQQNNIAQSGYKVPAVAVLKVTDREVDYYYNKMLLESKAKEN